MIQYKANELFYIRLSFFISIAICAVKFVAWGITGSLVILSDALESIINVAAAAFAWYSIYLSNKPKDKEHPYGHGKIQFFSIGFEGAMILIAGIGILIQAVHSFIHPPSLQALTAGIWLTVAGGVSNFILGYFLVKTGKSRNSLTLIGNGKHILSDSYSSIGVLIAVVLILITGYTWIDPLASVFAGVIIIFTGYRLVSKSVKGLMDEVDMNVIDELVDMLKLNRNAVWIDIHNMRVQRFGNYYHVDCHVTMPYYYSLEQVHDEITKLDTVLNTNFQKGSIEFFIHTDPCISSSCSHCLLSNCSVRMQPFLKQIEWSKENLLPNKKHAFVD